MTLLAVTATVAQLADLATARLAAEVSPVGAALLAAGLALPAKAALLALVMVAADAGRRRWSGRLVLLAATAAGVLGVVSNV